MAAPQYLSFNPSALVAETKREIINQQGLYTNANDGLAPAGTLAACENVVIDKLGVISSRRGFHSINDAKRDTEQFTIHKAIPFANGYLLFTSGGLFYQEKDKTPLKITNKNGGNIYFNTSPSYFSVGNGVYFFLPNGQLQEVLQTPAGEWHMALASPVRSSHASSFKPLFSEGETTYNTWLPANSSVAYRLCWTRRSTQQTYRGAPSPRSIYRNVGSTSVALRFEVAIPPGVEAGDSLEVYRSEADEYPSDEMRLVLTRTYTQNNKDDGVRLFTLQDEENSQNFFILYTSPSQEGATAENSPPPLARLATVYRSQAVYANTTRTASVVLSIANLSHLKEGDSLVLASESSQLKLFAGTRESVSTGSFAIGSGGSPYENAAITALSLTHIINAHQANLDFVATSYSDGESAALLIAMLNVGDSFRIYMENNGEAGAKERLQKVFKPLIRNIGTTSTEALVVKPNEQKNLISFSKPFSANAVPPYNDLEVGEKNEAIVAVAECYGYLFVFKEEGLYRISGNNPSNASVTLLDRSLRLVSKNAHAVIAGELYAITTKGIMRIHYEGGELLSGNVNDSVLQYTQTQNSSLDFLIGDEAEKRLIGFLAAENDLQPNLAFVLDIETFQWTNWRFTASGGGFHPKWQRLFLFDEAIVYEEGKNFDNKQYFDGLHTIGMLGKPPSDTTSGLPYQQLGDGITIDVLLQNGIFFYNEEVIDVGSETEAQQEVKGITFKYNEENPLIKGAIFLKIGNLGEELILLDENLNRIPTQLKRTFKNGASTTTNESAARIAFELTQNRTTHTATAASSPTVRQAQLVQLELLPPYQTLTSIAPFVSNKMHIAKRFRRFFQFNKLRLGSPAVLKEMRNLHFTFSNTLVDTAYVTLLTDVFPTPQRYPIPLFHMGRGFGEGAYDADVFGGGVSGEVSSRISLPQNMRLQRFLSITIENDSDNNPMTLTSLTAFYTEADDAVK